MPGNILTPPPVTGTIPGWTWSNVAAPQPPITNYPSAEQQTAFNAQGLPGAYANWFGYAVQPFAQYYTTARGGADEAVRDYRNLVNFWQSRTGRPITADEMSRLMYGFGQYAQVLGRQTTVSDLFDYVGRVLYQPPPTPQVSLLKMGEI